MVALFSYEVVTVPKEKVMIIQSNTKLLAFTGMYTHIHTRRIVAAGEGAFAVVFKMKVNQAQEEPDAKKNCNTI